MSAQPDLSKLSVGQFAERFRSEMIPLSNTFSYFCASVPLSEEDLKEYLEEPIAALPPSIAALLPKVSIMLVPYLERGDSKEKDGKEKDGKERGAARRDEFAATRALGRSKPLSSHRSDGPDARERETAEPVRRKARRSKPPQPRSSACPASMQVSGPMPW